MSDDEAHVAGIGADAALAATEKTAHAIERAVQSNDDPNVAEALDEAATHAETATARVGWLRGAIHRAFRRS